MPLTLRCCRLAPTAPSGLHAGYHSSTPAIDPWLVPPQTAPALLPSPLAAANSQRPVDHRALDPHRNPPSRLLPPAFGLRLAPSGAGLSVLPQRLRYRRSPACASLQLAGSSVQDAVLADLIPPVPSETVLEAHASRPALPDSPSGSALLHLACALHPWSVRPACLRVCLQLAPLVSAPAPPRARSAYLNSRLAPAVPASRALSNPTDDLLRGHRLLKTLGLPNLCTQVQNQRILWIKLNAT